ncbi:dihydroflavonol-4-reductase [Mycolicibacterium sp. BK634]|uniref:NAD-dependent epimerase/dehydratase family protein n=1 Tax=Mycobacteriaceae TaxID=1762 RepID=UPI00105B48FB|nr:NAD-dependent epimerase/dehydratase family protein [Mycobacterium sp. BK086]MBB3754134.1 dihydroflavonol-4-reductase [Mycolicibacterium sp. BK634]TDO17893.1 dihydroflavonol-4-reductase [Mycobacterium sp. BK086]
MAGTDKLVLGASGFLGSHVTRQLVERGETVRVMLRRSSSTKAIDDLPVQRFYGDIFDDAALKEAMDGCDVVFYCVVDTRANLRDPAPLYRTNVDGLRHVLDVAVNADLRRFVFTSTIGTIGLGNGGVVDEATPFNWGNKAGGYIGSRVAAEKLVLDYSRDKGLPAVALCVSNTYGARDWQPTPHGSLVAAAAAGKLPFYMDGMATEVVGIEDAARALVLAADNGRVGERYIISERYLPYRELYETAARAAGRPAPRLGIPKPVMKAIGVLGGLAAAVTRKDLPLNPTTVRLMDIMAPMDHGKAVRELGWQPRDVHESIREAVEFFGQRRRDR